MEFILNGASEEYTEFITNHQKGHFLQTLKGRIFSPILAFAPFFGRNEDMGLLWQYNITPSVYSLEAAEKLNRYALFSGRTIDVHIKVDTGLGRMGVAPDELLKAALKLREMGGLRYKGIYTHYSNAFEKRMKSTKRQRSEFLSLVRKPRRVGADSPYKVQRKFNGGSCRGYQGCGPAGWLCRRVRRSEKN